MKKLLFLLILFLTFVSNIDALKLNSIYIDGKKCTNNSSIETCLAGETYSYDSETKTLTLNNYNGGRITIYSTTNSTEEDEVTVHLKGQNIVTEKGSTIYAFASGIPLTITADDDASLTINGNYQSEQYISVALSCDKKLTINGGTINVNLRTDFESEKELSSVGINALEGLIIGGNANVSVNIDTDYSIATGIRVGASTAENIPLQLGENASLKIELNTRNKNAVTTSKYSYVIYGTNPDMKIEGNVEEQDSINNIVIDNKTCDFNSELSECIQGNTYSWDNDTRTLTLNNYNSGKIYVNAIKNTFNEYKPIKIHLKGNNTITEKSEYSALFSDFDTEITADDGATLVINNSFQKALTNYAVEVKKLLTISGGNITINNNFNYEADQNFFTYVIKATHGIVIKNNSNVTLKSTSDYNNSIGIYVGGDSNVTPKIYLEKDAKLTIDLSVKNKLKSTTISKQSYLSSATTTDIKIEGQVEEINNSIMYIYIDNKKCLNDETINECMSDNTYSWDEKNNTISLNNYDSNRIYIYDVINRLGPAPTIKIYLKGNNTIIEKSENIGLYSSGNVLIDAEENASLDIVYSRQNEKSNSAVDINGELTIQGGNVNINNSYEYDAGKDVAIYGVEANKGLIIKDDANVKINVTNNYTSVRGIVVGGTNIEKPKIYVENPASMEINLSTKNILNAENISLRTYTYYSGTIDKPDIKITGNLVEKPSFREITIDGKKCVNDSNVESCLSSETYSYDKETNTLTLNNYNGNQIKVFSLDPNLGHMEPIKIHLKGTNTIISETDYDTPLEIKFNLGTTITSDEGASLTITRKCPIVGTNVAFYVENADITLENADISVNNIYQIQTTSTYSSAGIYANNVLLKGKTNLKINVNTDYSKAIGIAFTTQNNPSLIIEKPAIIEMNVVSKNLDNADGKMSNLLYSMKDANIEINKIYKSNDNIEPKVYAGLTEESSQMINSLNEDLSKYQYLRIETGEEIKNPKTGENNLIYLLFIMIITFAVGSLTLINKKQTI